MEPKFNPYNTKGTVVFGRMRKLFLGKKTPPIFTRIACNLALLYFLYVFFWALTIFIAFHFGQNLPKAENWNTIFSSIGTKYHISDIHFSFTLYLISLLTCSVIMLAGVLMVWRNRLNGYLLVLIPTLVCTTIAFMVLGMEYVKNEASWFEFTFGGIVIALFSIDYFLKRRLV
jgi:hypothetical protein